MKILFITGLYPSEIDSYIKNQCKGIAYNQAANNFQWAFVDGLERCNANYHVVTLPTIPTFPLKYRSPFMKDSVFSYNGSTIGDVKGFCTIFGIKDFSIKYNLRKYVKRWLEQCVSENESVVILTYSPSYYFLSAIKDFKVKYKNLKIASIVTDLIDDGLDSSFRLSWLRRKRAQWEYEKIHSCYKFIDKYILLSKYMLEKIPDAINKNIVVEGVAKEKSYPVCKKDMGYKTLLYAGTLHEYAGINRLVDAFSMTEDESFRLIICGSGPSESYIRKKAQDDTRIIFKGMISDRDALMKLQSNSTCLINPRGNDSSFAKYAFPSKTMEYMLSGTPMIGYKLGGIPDEYFNHMFVVPDESIGSLVTTIDKVLSLSQEELDCKAREAYNFILSNKTSYYQVSRIIDFLDL